MCKMNSYTKYQRRVIQVLDTLLGTETPFTYEKTQTNHLKVLIDGVAKPLFTGSTPSDTKSLDNFMAEVKREIKAAHKVEPECVAPALPNPKVLSTEKLVQGCIKSFRVRSHSLKEQEEALVIDTGSVDAIYPRREEMVKQAIISALKTRKNSSYLKPKEMKALNDKVVKHLHFMLPNLAYYSERLTQHHTDQKAPLAGSTDTAPILQVSETAIDSEVASIQPAQNNVLPFNETHQPANVAKTPAMSHAQVPTLPTSPMSSEFVSQQPALELMALDAHQRVQQLRGLAKADALALINDIQQAMEMNQNQDIESVVALIRDKELPLDAIIARLNAA